MTAKNDLQQPATEGGLVEFQIHKLTHQRKEEQLDNHERQITQLENTPRQVNLLSR